MTVTPIEARVAAPLIGITGRRASAGAEVPVAVRGLRLDVHFSAYAQAATRVGGLAVQLSSSVDPRQLVRRLDGLVLAGGEDVDPDTYAGHRSALLGPVDAERDAFELSALSTALDVGIPVLGVCRGAQLINVAHGGTLHDHLDGKSGALHTGWHAPLGSHRHEISATPGSTIRHLIGPQASVNSLHHQSIDRVGRGLRVTARAGDGTVEAVENADALVIGVQWHPELYHGDSALFRWLVHTAAERAGTQHPHTRRNVV